MNDKEKPNPPVPPAPIPTQESKPDNVYRDGSTKSDQKEKEETTKSNN